MHHRSRIARTAAGALLVVAAFDLPASPVHAAPQWSTVFAHRAGAAYAPENTLAAVRNSARMGIAWVENDVQRTRDGQLVIIHDTTLDRTTNVERLYPERTPWQVKDFTLKEIKRLDAGSWFSRQYAGERVPTLKQYVDELDRTGQKLLLELKQPQLYPGIEQQTLALLRSEGWLDSRHVTRRLVIQSFSANSLRITHHLNPAVRTGLLGSPPVGRLKTYAAFADQINPRDTAATWTYINAVHLLRGPHGARLSINTWTVDDFRQAARLSALGVDGIITNRPDVIEDIVG